MLVRRPGDKKISGIAVLFQPDINARAKSAERKGVATSNNPREVIYPGEIWPRKEKETGRRREYAVERYIQRAIPGGRASRRVYMNESIGNPED